MGSLTTFLQQEFANNCPAGWTSDREIRLLPYDLEAVLGYSPRVDVLLERQDASQRLWIEFEVSRADPVANHAKFATAHLFQPQPKTDVFVSMVSPHVTRGRQNLAANTVLLMRHIGMNAFQTILFPQISPAEIKRLNHLDQLLLSDEKLNVKREIERAMLVSQAVLTTPERRIHFVANIMEIMLNLRQWNIDLATFTGRNLWGKRTITYFVFDPRSKSFAPSKFCAYLNVPQIAGSKTLRSAGEIRPEMRVEFYVTIDGTDRRFDGRRAWMHLVNNLAMVPYEPRNAPNIRSFFDEWLKVHQNSINVHPAGPIFLVPPRWFK